MTDERSSDQASERGSRARRRLRPIGIAGCLALALAGTGAGVTLASDGSTAGVATAVGGNGRDGKHVAGGKGIFSVRCPYSHSANDDPILMAGKAGAAMLHDFFGNRATDANSTASKLIGGHTTCTTSADASAYWVPALYDNGHRIRPKRMVNYWLGASRTGKTAPLPAGLEMIAGNERATRPQPLDRVHWDCHAPTGPEGTRNHGPKTSAPHPCASGELVRLTIKFPSCWDGHALSAVGQHNVVYPIGSRCPPRHPIALSRLNVHVFYPNSPAGKFTLSMGPGMQGSIYSAHADFLDGWKTSTIDRLITTCLNTHFKCGAVTGPTGAPRHQPSATVPAA